MKLQAMNSVPVGAMRTSRVWIFCTTRPWVPFTALTLCVYVYFLSVTGTAYLHTLTMDLPSFHAAAVVTFEQGGSPYVWEELQAFSPHRVHPYLYPPPSLFLFRPLAGLTLKQACTAAAVANNFLVLLLGWVVPFHLLCLSPRKRFGLCLLAVVVMLLSHPTHMCFALGQVNLLLTLFLVSFWVLARRNHSAWAGVFLALACILKVYPVLLLPLLLVVRRTRDAAWAVAWLLVAAAVSCVLLPCRLWLDWAGSVVLSGGYGRVVENLGAPSVSSNIGLNGSMSRLFEPYVSGGVMAVPPAGRLLTYGLAALILMACLAAVWRSRRGPGEGVLDRVMLVALPCIFLLGPISWHHHLVYLLPVILMLLAARCPWPAAARTGYYAATGIAGLLLCTVWGLSFEFLAVVTLFAAGILVAVCPDVQLSSQLPRAEAGVTRE